MTDRMERDLRIVERAVLRDGNDTQRAAMARIIETMGETDADDE